MTLRSYSLLHATFRSGAAGFFDYCIDNQLVRMLNPARGLLIPGAHNKAEFASGKQANMARVMAFLVTAITFRTGFIGNKNSVDIAARLRIACLLLPHRNRYYIQSRSG